MSRPNQIGADAVAANVFSKNGIEPSSTWAYLVMFLELVGGIGLIIGLFTRLSQPRLAIETLVALLFVHSAERVRSRWWADTRRTADRRSTASSSRSAAVVAIRLTVPLARRSTSLTESESRG